HNPLLKEGTPRRSKIVMLPQVIGAAGVVSLSFSYSFTNRFEHRLDVLTKNHNAFRLQEPRPLDVILLLQLRKVGRRIPRRKDRQFSDLCCVVCGTSGREVTVVEGVS